MITILQIIKISKTTTKNAIKQKFVHCAHKKVHKLQQQQSQDSIRKKGKLKDIFSSDFMGTYFLCVENLSKKKNIIFCSKIIIPFFINNLSEIF